MQKRRILILEEARKAHLREETLPELQPDQVLLRSLLTSFKHGTEMLGYNGSSSFLKKSLDPESRLFVENDGGVQERFYPRPLGNMTVGVVEKLGGDVHSLAVGETVFGWLPVADWHISSAAKLTPMGDLTAEQALCIDPASFALGGVLDGDIRAGERVLITGLGAIGLLAIQYCKLYGATVYAASSFDLRSQLAREYGADVVLDGRKVEDLGLAIKQLTGRGVDLALECSGSYAKLHQAVRATRQCGRVVCVGIYHGGATDLRLGEEFIHNRITLLASLPAFSYNNPVRGVNELYAQDLQKMVIEDFKSKRVKVEGLVRPIYPLSESEKAADIISSRPEEVIKVAIKY